MPRLTPAAGPTALVEMLFSTSLVTVVPRPDAPESARAQRLQIVNTKRQSTICELSFPAPICHVRLNRRRLVVALASAFFVYDISNMKLLHTIDTAQDTHGLCALAPSSEQCFLAYAAPLATQGEAGAGSVVVYDLLTLGMACVVPAHRTRVACLAFNAAGTLLATASEKGTVVRVFSVPDGKLVSQFRRGSYPARILAMTFNAASTLLCVSSDTGTVHLFRLAAQAPATRHDDPDEALERKRSTSLLTAWGRQSKSLGQAVAGSIGTYLPASFTEMWEPARDFAYLKLPHPGVHVIAAVSKYVSARVRLLTQHPPAGDGRHVRRPLLRIRARSRARWRMCPHETYVPFPHAEYSLLDSGMT